MTSQEHIEQNVRMALGDLMLQTIILKARITELEEAQSPAGAPDRSNGRPKDKEARI